MRKILASCNVTYMKLLELCMLLNDPHDHLYKISHIEAMHCGRYTLFSLSLHCRRWYWWVIPVDMLTSFSSTTCLGRVFNIAIYKDTVPWPLYICTLIEWLSMWWDWTFQFLENTVLWPLYIFVHSYDFGFWWGWTLLSIRTQFFDPYLIAHS